MSDDSQTTLAGQSALVIDYGYFPEMAKALGGKNGYGKVYYATNWHGYNPTPDKCWMGKGVPGLIHLEEYEDILKMVDLIAYFDVGDRSRMRALRADGHKVFGADGMIELDRLYFKQILAKAKLPQPPWEEVTGVDSLRALLQEMENLWVKIDSKWRGIKETWFHEDWETSYTTVDELAHRLGCFRKIFRWIVEHPWPGIEGGADYLYSRGRVLPLCTEGWEEKNELYLMKVVPVEQTSKPIRKIQLAMDPFRKEWQTSGSISTEVRILSEAAYGYNVGEGYYLDATERMGEPPGASHSGLWLNFPHIVRACANGEMITPAPRAKYAAQIILKSAQAICESCPVSVEKGFEDNVKFRRQCVVDGQMFIIPMHEDEIIGSAVGYGRTKEEAEDQALEAADKVHCKELYYNDSFDCIHETLEMAKELGMGVF